MDGRFSRLPASEARPHRTGRLSVKTAACGRCHRTLDIFDQRHAEVVGRLSPADFCRWCGRPVSAEAKASADRFARHAADLMASCALRAPVGR